MSQLTELVTSRFNDSKKFRQAFDSKWNNYYKLYRNYLENRDEHKANLFIPYTFWTIETIIPRMVGSRPKVLALPREESDRMASNIATSLLDYQWEMLDMDQKRENLVRVGLIYGSAFLKVSWDHERDMPMIQNADIFDVYVDPEAVTIEDARYVIHRTRQTFKELQEVNIYSNLSKVETLTSQDTEKVKQTRFSVQGASQPDGDVNFQDGKIEILEYWDGERVVTVAGGKVVIRDQENPYPFTNKPFVMFKDYPVAEEFYGIGEVEHIESLQNEGNSLRNQITDNNRLIVNRMYKVVKSGGINLKNLTSGAGGIVGVNQHTDIEPFETQPIPESAYRLEEKLKNDIQQTTGITDYQVGPTSSTRMTETATGISLLQEGGNQRIKGKLKHLEMTLRDLGSMMIALNQQFMRRDKVIRIIGQEGVQFQNVGVADIIGKFDVKCEAGSVQPFDKNTEKMRLVELINLLAQPQFVGITNWTEIEKMLLDKFDIKNIQDIIMQPQPQVEPEMQNMLANTTDEEFRGMMANKTPQEAEAIANQLENVGQTG